MTARWKRQALGLLLALVCGAQTSISAQDNEKELRRNERRGAVRSVTIPVTILGKGESEIQVVDFIIVEDDEPQQILTVRGVNRAPLILTILIQDDLISSIGNEIEGLANFIRRLPEDSRVSVGYLRAGSLQVRQRFTSDLERAAKSLRIPVGSSNAAPYNPFSQAIEAAQSAGSRRAQERRNTPARAGYCTLLYFHFSQPFARNSHAGHVPHPYPQAWRWVRSPR